MKKRLCLWLLMLFVIFSLTSCVLPGLSGNNNQENEGGNDNTPTVKENLIYDKNVELYVIYDSSAVTAAQINLITDKLVNYGIYARAGSSLDEKHAHEIVIGNMGRSVSDSAYMFLERLDKNSEDDLRYCIYSDGSSVAIAYDEDESGAALEAAISFFADNYVGEELVLRKGVAKEDSFDMFEFLALKDRTARDEKFDRLASVVGGEDGVAIAEAFKTLYSVYDGKALINWLSNLYDTNICVCTALYGESECKSTQYCGTGAFYYSNSARDNFGFLPDAESTMQALNFLGDCGISPVNGSYVDIVPDWMAEEICDYLYNLQDPDGYFYHPQWGKDIGNAKRGRDLSWCTTILAKYGVTLKYKTISDAETVEPTAGDALTGLLGKSAASAVSKVILTESETLIPEHLKTVAAFKAYLNGLDIKNNSYGAGNTLSAQAGQIISRGEAYTDALIEHLNSCQFENGIWHKDTDYYGINGLMKISGVYNMLKAPIPNAEAACRAAFAAVSSTETVDDVVDIWNAWDAAKRVIGNIGSYAENGAVRAKELRGFIMSDAAAALIKTREKLAVFLKSDGSFSYNPDKSSYTSQGSVIAMRDTNEGDMNATAIATTYMINTLFECLGLQSYKVSFMGSTERIIFERVINDLSPIVKTGNNSLAGEPYDFDYDNEGSTPAQIITKGTSTSMVIPDERGEGNVFKFDSQSGVGSYLTVKNLGVSGNATGMAFESELCILTENISGGDLRLDLSGDGEFDTAYRIIFKPNGDRIEIWDNASGTLTNNQSNYLGASVKSGEWFKLRIEYYFGNERTVRAKIYLDGRLAAISDNFFDSDGKKLVGEGTPVTETTISRFYVLKDSELTMLVDDICSYYISDKYEYEELDSEYLAYPYSLNVDRVKNDEEIYEFNDGIPDSFTLGSDGNAAVDNGELTLSGGASVTLGASKLDKFVNCSSVGMTLNVKEAAVGRALRINFIDRNEAYSSITAVALEVIRDGDGYVMNMVETHTGKIINGIKLPLGESIDLRIDYYEKEGVLLIYVNGVMEGMLGSLATTAKRYVFGRLAVESYSGSVATVDNLYANRSYKSYEEATSPKYDGKVYGFDNGKDDIITSGSVSVINGNDDAYLRFVANDKSSQIKVPLLVRDDVKRGVRVEFYVEFYDFNGAGQTHIYSITDESGEKIISFALAIDGDKARLFEKTSLGVHSVPILEFVASEGASIGFDYYESYGICKVFLNGEYVIETALLYSSSASTLVPEYFTVDADKLNSVAFFDDIETYRANLLYIPVNTQNKEENSPHISFDYSGGSNYPSKITSNIYSGAPEVSVVEALKDGKADKVIKFESYVAPNAGMDSIKFNPTVSDKNAISYVFEADVMIADFITALPVQFNLWGPKERAVEINLEISDGVISLYNTGLKNSKVAAARVGEWFTLRVEYYTVEINGEICPRTKVFIDGELLYVTDDYEGTSPVSAITYASFNALKGSGVTLLLDDISFAQSTEAYDGSNVTHTLH